MLDEPPSLEIMLHMFYEQEKNIIISSFWEGGWYVGIGDDLNGFDDGVNGLKLSDVSPWLWAKFKEMYGNT